MSSGGRPKEEEGHTPLKISVNKFISEALEKVDNKSQFIEKAVKPLLEQLDPGPACDFIRQIDQQFRTGITRAVEAKDYAKVQALSSIAYALNDYRSLCELPNPTSVISQENPPNVELSTEIKGCDRLRIADREFEENNLPRSPHPEDALPTFIVEGKFTSNPLFDLAPAFTTRHTRER